jgi:hypothetical protein
MAAPLSPIIASPILSLPEINTLVAQQESILGPLVSIGNDGVETLLFFDFERDPPEMHAVIGTGDPPPDAPVLATGKMYVRGRLEDVSAYCPG